MDQERKRVGHAGAIVAQNIQRIRERKNLTKPELARRINGLKQVKKFDDWELQPPKINALAITRIESGERRTDVDDLILISTALGVSPITLLMPNGAPTDSIDTPNGDVSQQDYWMWLSATSPLPPDPEYPSLPTMDERYKEQFYIDSLPHWVHSARFNTSSNTPGDPAV